MLLYKLQQLEIKTNKTLKKEQNKLVSITVLKTLLQQIDYNAEIISTNRFKPLAKLLINIKCCELTNLELKLLKQILK